MKKYYAVKNGYHIGIFDTWSECKKEVDGYSFAEYKSFKTRAEAEAYVRGDDFSEKSGDTPNCEAAREVSEDTAAAYCDGSFDEKTFRYSYGLVIFYKGEELRFSKAFEKDDNSSMRNVAGEIEGSMAAMRYCADNGIKTLELYYDYIGIEKWCTGGWKTNKPGTINYKRFYDEISKSVKVVFHKVAAHTGDEYNEEADMLAKSALGIK